MTERQKLKELQKRAEEARKYGIKIDVFLMPGVKEDFESEKELDAFLDSEYSEYDNDGPANYEVDVNGKVYSNYIDLQEADGTVTDMLYVAEKMAAPKHDEKASEKPWINITVDESSREEFIGQLIDQVEDMLAEYNDSRHKNVRLLRTEEAKKTDPDIGEDVVIAGDDYDELHDRFRGLLEGWAEKHPSVPLQTTVPADDAADSPVYVITRNYVQSDYTEPHYFEAARDAAEIVGYARTKADAEMILAAKEKDYDGDEDKDKIYYEATGAPLIPMQHGSNNDAAKTGPASTGSLTDIPAGQLQYPWIIAVANSAADGVILYKMYGTVHDAELALLILVREDAAADSSAWEYGTESIEEIEYPGSKELQAYNTFAEYHIDYTAKAMDKIPVAHGMSDIPEIACDEELYVDTPAGQIVARKSPDRDYPGIWILNKSVPGTPGALMAYSEDGSWGVKGMNLIVYGPEDPDGDPVAIIPMGDNHKVAADNDKQKELKWNPALPKEEKIATIRKYLHIDSVDDSDDDIVVNFYYDAAALYGCDSIFDADETAWICSLFGYDIGWKAARSIANMFYEETEESAAELTHKDKKLVKKYCRKLGLDLDFSKWASNDPDTMFDWV